MLKGINKVSYFSKCSVKHMYTNEINILECEVCKILFAQLYYT